MNYRPNRHSAHRLRETFTDRPATEVTTFRWNWPRSMKLIGSCEAVMYRSDKWQEIGDFADYKHIAEGPQNLYISPRFLTSSREVKVYGQMEPLPRMPAQFAELADAIGVQAQLFDEAGEPGDYVQIDLEGYKLGGFKVAKKTYLCVYDESSCKCIIDGVKLDILKDGITG